MSRCVVVTGAAGFIGSALVQRLLASGDRVIGIDNLNDYYDPALKRARLAQIEATSFKASWIFHQIWNYYLVYDQKNSVKEIQYLLIPG